MSSESVKDLRAFQGNDLYKYTVLHYVMFLFYWHVKVGLIQRAAYVAFTP